MSLPSCRISPECRDYHTQYNYHDREGQKEIFFGMLVDEIALEIFSYLKLDLPALAFVSKDFQRLADDPVLYKAWYPAAAVGVKKLHEYLRDDQNQEIEQEARLPRRVHQDLAEGKYIDKDGKEQQKYMLTWVDEKFSGKSLTLEYMHELVNDPKKGTKTGFDFERCLKEVIAAEREIKKPHWCLHPKASIPKSKYTSRVQKLEIIEGQRKDIPGLYLPSGRDTAFSVFMNHVITGEMCFPLGEYIMVNEQIEDKVNGEINVYSIAFGGLSAAGLHVFSYYYNYYDDYSDGVAGVRKSFGT